MQKNKICTFPLPESQLDRFLMRIELGYPDRAAERELLAGTDRREMLDGMAPCLDAAGLIELQQAATRIHAAPPLVDYVQALAEYTRHCPDFEAGLSPRAALGLLAAARAWTLLEKRDHILPEDIQAVLPAIVGHRLRPAADSGAAPGSDEIARRLIESVPLP